MNKITLIKQAKEAIKKRRVPKIKVIAIWDDEPKPNLDGRGFVVVLSSKARVNSTT